MKRLLSIIGRITYFATYPALALYLSKDHRTRLVICHGNHVLLVRSWLSNGKWDLPGGGLHRHEDPLAGVLREVSEELGLSLPADSVESITVNSYHSGLIRYQVHYFKWYSCAGLRYVCRKWRSLTPSGLM